jgi:hypothetical protein
MKMRTIQLAAVALLCASLAYAAGSVSFDQVKIVLEQNADVGRTVVNAFEFQNTGSATRLGRQFKKLGGARVGPYGFLARPRGSKGGYDVEIRVCTTLTFLDAGGNLLKNRNEAAKVRETFKAVVIRKAGADAPDCD